ncbi:MAG TPA: rhomboid family intramembrane serine protease [Thermoanaerobaculia bacterium]|jgi:membrane associated rhomboid family serine protease|nr:rhomboid family intramembrane serine protease [Thermoanaerobaculia bacterium]
MFRSRGENLRSVYILLFLTIAFFFLEYQDTEKYARLFSFERGAVAAGEVWRVFTYQFTQAGQGWFVFPRPLVLFFTLLLLYLMGSSVEEEWGTWNFLAFFAISTVGSAITAAALGIPLLGSYFVNFSLLFVYASTFPQQTFYLFGAVPVRIRWIAYVAALVLIAGVFAGGRSNIAALVGCAVSYAFFLSQRVRVIVIREKDGIDDDGVPDGTAIRNAARFVAIKRAINSGNATEIDRLIAQSERDIVRGVNICPPPDFKPENNDGYCIRCEGFSECSVRFMMMKRPAAAPPENAVPEGTTS